MCLGPDHYVCCCSHPTTQAHRITELSFNRNIRLVYLSIFSKPLARLYIRLALLACRWAGVAPSFLLHPLDFVGPTEAPELGFFPGMALSLEHKLEVASYALAQISKHFQMVPLRDQVAKHSAAASSLTAASATIPS